jgi:hypothetical protein
MGAEEGLSMVWLSGFATRFATRSAREQRALLLGVFAVVSVVLLALSRQGVGPTGGDLCRDYVSAANPVAGARGPANAWLMLIGQAPGRLSVERGIPFGGPGGIVLGRWLDRALGELSQLRERFEL